MSAPSPVSPLEASVAAAIAAGGSAHPAHAEPVEAEPVEGEPEHAWLIWSNEHGAWWKPGEWGYTRLIEEAGRYTERRARQICARAWPPIEAANGGTFPREVKVRAPVPAAPEEPES